MVLYKSGILLTYTCVIFVSNRYTDIRKMFNKSQFSRVFGRRMADLGIVDEFPATSAVLLAAAFVIEDACKPVNDKFMICKNKTEDPADCVPAGESVQQCVNSVYRSHSYALVCPYFCRFERIKKSPCQPLFERFWKCLDMNNQNFIYCREEEQAFHQCVKVNLVYTTY